MRVKHLTLCIDYRIGDVPRWKRVISDVRALHGLEDWKP